MKVLFATLYPIADNERASALSTNINLAAVENVFGKENVEVCHFVNTEKPNFFMRQFRHIVLDKKKIESKIASVDVVFCDVSMLGYMAKQIKMYPDKIVVTHFHNIEYYYFRMLHVNERNVLLRAYRKIRNCWIYSQEMFASEKNVMAYADGVVFLTGRNKRDATKLYGQPKRSLVLPVSTKDRFDKGKIKNVFAEGKLSLLFVGSDHPPNIHGLRWFIKNVLPYIDAELVVIGFGIENYKHEWKLPNVSVIGSVNETAEYYYSADAVVSPLLHGEGMKLKIAEALMYGKTIFGTSESFEGYELDFKRVGGLCEDAEEFIDAINDFSETRPQQKFNQYSRDIYERDHAPQKRIDRLSGFLREI